MDIHRGVSQHTNGYYNVLAFYNLNLLIGNYDYAGGMTVAKAYDQAGGKEGQPFPVAKMVNGGLKKFGADIIRSQVKYETTTIFEDYPAKRPWYPLATDIYQEIVPSIGDAYPYPIKAMFLYMGSPVYALPAGHTNIEVLKDPEKLPLFVCFDITIGETSMYADYIIPDMTFLERWEFQKSHPSVIAKIAPVRQPVIGPLTETVTVFGVEQPLGLESFLLGVAEKMGLPTFGPDGFGEGQPFMRQEDLYLKEVANIAFGEKAEGKDAVPEADDAEMELFRQARRHLPADGLRRGGMEGRHRRRREAMAAGRLRAEPRRALPGLRPSCWTASSWRTSTASTSSMYCEKTYDAKNSMTGEHFSGVARYFEPGVDAAGHQCGRRRRGRGLRHGAHYPPNHRADQEPHQRQLLAHGRGAHEHDHPQLGGRPATGGGDRGSGARRIEEQSRRRVGPGQWPVCAHGGRGAGGGGHASGCGGLLPGLRPLGLWLAGRDHRRPGGEGRGAAGNRRARQRCLAYRRTQPQHLPA